MRNILIFFCSIASLSAQAQTKNDSKHLVYYKADLISQEMLQHELTDSQKVVYDKPLGFEVSILVDTLFNKYTIIFKDENYKDVGMVLNYKRNYFIGISDDGARRIKQFLMEAQEEKFFLQDRMEKFPFYELIICWEKPFPNGCTLKYKITNVKRTSL